MSETPRSLRDWLFTALRIAVGGVLFYAGFMKLNSTAQFAELIANYRILPAQGNQLAAAVLPWCEVSTGLFLITGIWTRAAGMVASTLFLIFAGGVTAALVRGLDIECGCFGTESHARVGLETLVKDVAGLIAAMVVVLKKPIE
jgi:uncharacterized membrane protein YphA (DoxX/SURF4 family)